MSGYSAIALSAPTAIDLVLTQQCNHRCLHCYNPWRVEEVSDKADCNMTSFQRIEFIVEQLAKHNIWSVTITGGEPLADPALLYHAITCLKEKHIAYGLNSNLTLMSDKIASDLVTLGFSPIILTSLPSITPTICDKITQAHGSYERIMRGVAVCHSHGIGVEINMVVTKMNLPDLKNLAAFVKTNSISYVSLSAAIPPLYDLENPNYHLDDADLTAIAETLVHINEMTGVEINSVIPFPICVLGNFDRYQSVLATKCSAGITKCAIDVSTGDITACTHEDSPYGNIYDDDILVAWGKMGCWRNGENISDQCSTCGYLAICGGECRMMKHRSCVAYTLDPKKEITISPPQFPQVRREDRFTLAKGIVLRRKHRSGNGCACNSVHAGL